MLENGWGEEKVSIEYPAARVDALVEVKGRLDGPDGLVGYAQIDLDALRLSFPQLRDATRRLGGSVRPLGKRQQARTGRPREQWAGPGCVRSTKVLIDHAAGSRET